MPGRAQPLADALIAALVVLGSGAYLVVARSEASGADRRDLLGQAGFPQALAIVAIVCGAVIFARALVRWRGERSSTPAEPAADAEPTTWRPLALWGLTLGYVIALIPVGFLLATPLFVFVALWVVGFQRTVLGTIVALGATAVLFVIFDVLLGVNLPGGVLFQLAAAGP